MKIEIQKSPKPSESSMFPDLFELIDEPGYVVLAFGKHQGLVMKDPSDSARETGQIFNIFIPFSDTKTWKKFSGKIILTGE